MSSHHVSTVSCVTTFSVALKRLKEGVGVGEPAFSLSAERDQGVERNTSTYGKEDSTG